MKDEDVEKGSEMERRKRKKGDTERGEERKQTEVDETM